MKSEILYQEWMIASKSLNCLDFFQGDGMTYCFNWVFPKLYKIGNVVNTGLFREEWNKFSPKNIILSGDRTQYLLILALVPSWLS